MSDENQDSTKLPNINEDEHNWLIVMLAFFKPNKVYEAFLYEFPRLAEYADEHGIPDEDLKTTIRSADMSVCRAYTSTPNYCTLPDNGS